MRTAVHAATLGLLMLTGCERPREPARPIVQPSPTALAQCGPHRARGPVAFPRSPGGAAEVDAAWLATHRCDVRVVDVREPDELVGALGRIDVADPIPIAQIEQRAESWARDAPLVLVCRSGRRSERAAAQLRALGFRHVATLTGGMLAWKAASLPVTHDVLAAPPPTRPAADASQDLLTTLARPDALVWTRAASLLGANTVSCIDGRAESPVLGTPGGDAGELVLSLAALEHMLGQPVTSAWIGTLFDRYVAAFGRFYLHTDHHAVERLADALREDPRTRAAAVAWHRPDDVVAFLRAPPHEMEDALLEHLVEPAHVGCGHLRLMIQEPGRYDVRPGLVADVLRAAFREGWRRPELLELAILEGEHEERGVLEVRVEHEVHAHSLVPMVAPHVGARELFVLHPQVTDFVRAENAWFLVEQLDPALRARVDAAALRARIAALGARQLAATVSRLAPHLPRYRMRVTAQGQTIESLPAPR